MTEPIVASRVNVERGGRAVLRDVDFAAPAAAVTAILGPNGAGKSTLLKAIAGLLPFSGDIRVTGERVEALSPQQRAQAIAYVPQHTQLRAPLRVRDVVALGRYAQGRGGESPAKRARHVDGALEKTSTTGLARRAFTELSGGEQRGVLLARALATGAPVLLLDEPTSSLDIRHGLAVFTLCRQLASEGRTIIIVLHQLADALRFADHVLLLHAGQGVAAGPAHRVIVDARVREIYGVRMIAEAAPSFEPLDPIGTQGSDAKGGNA